ncbi:MAG TPA: adenylate/guanylate cyclase domain-containing protein [Rhodospirillales bacterium]|jgi:adenylate cyclase|nr:adenylate/guanylate cyclase domain-containing protein [Rhodospirillales bacterium]
MSGEAQIDEFTPALEVRPLARIAPADGPDRVGSVRWCANPMVEWLLTEGWSITVPADFLDKLVARMVASGMALSRVRLTIRTLHPQVIGTSYTWNRGTEGVDVFEPPHSIVQTDSFLKSPYAAIFEGAGAIRCRLDVPGSELAYPVLDELRAAGATDYVALPIVFSDGKINAITLTTDRAGGFTTEELTLVYEMLPVLARLVEVHAAHHTARTLLDTYLGAHTGEKVLDGLVKRGDGEDIHAVIWFCDLRESTRLAESMPRAAFLGLLNDFYDCMAGSILDHGGEVLRFIGDAALAIFPIVEDDDAGTREICTRYDACRMALAAAREAMARIDSLNERRADAGQPPIGFGIGLHIGDVTYGNIGVPQRLEFTVIGAAANEAARIESQTKAFGTPIVVSAEFARFFPGELASLGRVRLSGVDADQELFTLPDFKASSRHA